ncbi:MAG: GDSL-type esterase/lipase family protein [Candidatus Uhrbacteria bacterium]|nr:GDSL-type esterase/lipase family protein [Candidatus Uhrbacteria bacterium]
MNICIFGDSIAWGANDFELGGWTEHLKNNLYTQERSHDVYNLGISGDATTQAIKRINVEASVRKADVIVFALGINDSAFLKSRGERWTPLAEFKNNLALLFEAAQKFTEIIIFVGLTPVDESKTMPAPWAPDYFVDSKTTKEYNAVIREFCEDKKIQFISMDDVLTPDDLSDGLHPNTAGHKKMFEKIQKELHAII